MRYAQLNAIIHNAKPSTIVEFGTWNGIRAVQMATEALKHQSEVRYLGIDLFEQGTDELDERELNVKVHEPAEVAQRRLQEFAETHAGFSFDLWQGDSRDAPRDLVSKWAGGPPDFVFIDGGHSIDTIRNDFSLVRDARVIVFDDFYSGEGCPDITRYGCNRVLAEIEDRDHLILPAADPVVTGGHVQMVVTPAAMWSGQANVHIKTKNCVPDEEIQANIRANTPRITRWVVECDRHDRKGALVSAGPSFPGQMDTVRRLHAAGAYIVCVKHAHDALIENGITPHACVLLDPRSHVQDFIENPHPEVTYIVASMVHPTTLDRLLERGARIVGYHALVGAGETALVRKLMNTMSYPMGLIGGGSAASVRGISVLHALGFRNLALISLDCCYAARPDEPPINKTTGRPEKVMTVNVSGRAFHTNAELLAQAQDFDKLLKQPQSRDMRLECYGDGIISHIWTVAQPLRPNVDLVLGP